MAPLCPLPPTLSCWNGEGTAGGSGCPGRFWVPDHHSVGSLQEEAQAKEEEGVPDEEGWVKVTRRGRRPVLPRTEAASLRVLEKERRKRARKELLNFYAWQHRETKMERKGAPQTPVLQPHFPWGSGPADEAHGRCCQPRPARRAPTAALGPGCGVGVSLGTDFPPGSAASHGGPPVAPQRQLWGPLGDLEASEPGGGGLPPEPRAAGAGTRQPPAGPGCRGCAQVLAVGTARGPPLGVRVRVRVGSGASARSPVAHSWSR